MKVSFTLDVFKQNLADNLYKNGAGARRAIGRSSEEVFPEEDRVKARALVDKKFGPAGSVSPKVEVKSTKVSPAKKPAKEQTKVAPPTEKRKPGRPKGYSPKKAAEQKAKEASKADFDKKYRVSKLSEVSLSNVIGSASALKNESVSDVHVITVLSDALTSISTSKERFTNVDFTRTVNKMNLALLSATENIHNMITASHKEHELDLVPIQAEALKESMNGIVTH